MSLLSKDMRKISHKKSSTKVFNKESSSNVSSSETTTPGRINLILSKRPSQKEIEQAV